MLTPILYDGGRFKMLGIITSIRRFFCSHRIIRYWETENINERGREYKVSKFSCMDCGHNFEVKRRI